MASTWLDPEELRPRIPPEARDLGIGLVGCGGIARSAHLPAYRKYGLRVVGVYDIRPEAAAAAAEAFGVRTYPTLEALLADPQVAVVDVATHPRERVGIVRQALQAGKHVFSQKPFAPTLEEARELTEEAARRGLRLAVNQNGRWAPPWRGAALLVERGAVGEVLHVTHLWEVRFGWITGTPFDQLTHFAIYDYGVHWIDITRCFWGRAAVRTVRARDWRLPIQPPESKTPWGAWIALEGPGAAEAVIRGTGGAATHGAHPFWIHGTEGTVRGAVLGDDHLELERGGVRIRFDLPVGWVPDAFAGSMGELLAAVVTGREPHHAARDNLHTLAATLAACASAEADGAPVVPAAT